MAERDLKPIANVYSSTVEGEARLLLLIDAYSGRDRMSTLDGRTKLAKLDFLLRYPMYLRRALQIRRVEIEADEPAPSENNIEQRMVRFRYGPWDPAYYALLGSLLGRGLIETLPGTRVIGFRTTQAGRRLARELAATDTWEGTARRIGLLRRAFPTQGGTFLKDFIYEHFPEVARASWGQQL